MTMQCLCLDQICVECGFQDMSESVVKIHMQKEGHGNFEKKKEWLDLHF